jgi:3-dehydroquinate synthase
MIKVTVNASNKYDILIGDGLLDKAGEFCRDTIGKCRVCVITDDTVNALYFDRLNASLEKAGYSVLRFVFPHGEGSKHIGTITEILEFCAENRLTRSDCLIALGGGVVGDMTGFAAAIYLRGIRFVQIPTTVLAAVDSSVGGKTGVDLKSGKNLCGAFHQPSLVICDCKTTDTLTREIFSDGCAEIIKYGVINDRPFFEFLKKGIRENLEEIIAECVRNKARVVEDDEFDKGSRQLLNLGHTVGHAIEICSDLTISHGSAVAIGMVIVTRAAVKMGICPENDLFELISLLEANNLPTSCDYSAKELAAVASTDKKRAGASISAVLPYGIGDSRLYKIPVEELEALISKGICI